MRKGHLFLTGVLITILVTAGCSGGSGSPVSPELERPAELTSTPNEQLLFGLYDIELDVESMTAEVIPLRGPSFQANIVQYLQPPFGSPANLKVSIDIPGSDIANGIFDMDISITHPFPGTNLRGFDVRGIFLGAKGTQLSEFDWDVQYPKPTEARLLNADGYTRWWNAVEFLTPGLWGYTPPILGNTDPKATVNGYKYFTDELGADDPMILNPDNRGTFSTQDTMSEANKLTRNFMIRFPMAGGSPSIKFRYAICASFEPPTPGTPPPGPVEAYPTGANCPEPYQISVSMAPESTAYYTSTGTGGDLIMNIEIFDWQAPENPAGVPGELGYVVLESPTMWDGYINLLSEGVMSDGPNPTSSVWQIEIEDIVADDYQQDVFIIAQSADPTSYMPPVPGGGIYPGGAVLSAYYLYTIDMPGNSPPTIGDIYGPDKFVPGAELVYTLESAEDLQDGPNVTITWDFDGDGVFEDDLDGSDTNFEGEYIFTEEETHYVQCRVYDTAMAYSDSNILEVDPMSLPFIDPMDTTTETLWTVENSIFEPHTAALEWNVQGEYWASGSPTSSQYENYMDTTLISPLLPAGENDEVQVTITHRYQTESAFFDTGQVVYQVNDGPWLDLSPQFNGSNTGYPEFIDQTFTIGSLNPGDYFQIGFHWNTDSSSYYYEGWDITHVQIIDNEPPSIEGIWGPQVVTDLGPHQYTTVANDLDGIAEYMWSVEGDGEDPVYDDPGDGMGGLDHTFAADGNWDIYVKVIDNGDPPLSDEFGPYPVTVSSSNPDAFYHEDFDIDPGTWSYTGESYQAFWHIDTVEGVLWNQGPDGCFAEELELPTEKTASVDIIIPDTTNEVRLKMLFSLECDTGGPTAGPYDGQWVTLDDTVIEPGFGFLYDDKGGIWDQGYFHGVTGGYVVSTWIIDPGYADGGSHTLTLHQLSIDEIENCYDGWKIDFIEMWEMD